MNEFEEYKRGAERAFNKSVDNWMVAKEENEKLRAELTEARNERDANAGRVAVLESVRQWISVEERFPPIDPRYEHFSEVVLAVDSLGRRYCAFVMFTNDLWVLDYSNDAIEGITHWMPLPAGPEVAK